MMKDLFRETAFGCLTYLFSRGKLFAYDEETDPNHLKIYTISNASIDSTLGSSQALGPSNTSIEKGTSSLQSEKDLQLIYWNENDPHNPRNWSSLKKIFVTFQICLLTIYPDFFFVVLLWEEDEACE